MLWIHQPQGNERVWSVHLLCDARITSLHLKPSKNTDLATIQQLLKRLETLDGEYRTHHFAAVDLVEKETLGEEQAVVDVHDNKILILTEKKNFNVSSGIL